MTSSVAPQTQSKGNNLFYLLAALAILAIAVAIRIHGAFNDLWLDEIWSIKIAGKVTSPLDVFTKLHHEINHYFNTLWIWWMGNRGNWPGYRVPSLIAGSGSVVMAGLIGLRRNKTTAIISMLVVGFSYVMILYSSEARGYAMAVFFSFLSYYALGCYHEKPRWQWVVIFSTSSILGIVSQPIFVSFLLAALAWSVYRLAKPFRGWKSIATSLLCCYAAPFLFLAALYWIDMRKIVIGGGTSSPLLDAYGAALAWGLGTPLNAAGKIVTATAAVAIFLGGLYLLWNERSGAPIFFAGVILVFPILLIVIRGSDVIYPRHFIIAIAFLLILFSYVLASLFDRGGPSRIGSVVLLAVYFFINGQLVNTFFKYGRGHYRAAIRFMADNTKFPRVTIGSDHDFQTTMVLEFYGREPFGNKDERYLPRNLWPPSGPEWFVCHKESFESPTPPAMQLNDNNGHRYEFVKAFPSTPLCGLHWFIYHNLSDGPLEVR